MPITEALDKAVHICLDAHYCHADVGGRSADPQIMMGRLARCAGEMRQNVPAMHDAPPTVVANFALAATNWTYATEEAITNASAYGKAAEITSGVERANALVALAMRDMPWETEDAIGKMTRAGDRAVDAIWNAEQLLHGPVKRPAVMSAMQSAGKCIAELRDKMAEAGLRGQSQTDVISAWATVTSAMLTVREMPLRDSWETARQRKAIWRALTMARREVKALAHFMHTMNTRIRYINEADEPKDETIK